MSEDPQEYQFDDAAFKYSAANRDLLCKALEQTINRFCCEFSFSHAEVIGVLEIIKHGHLVRLLEQRKDANE